MNKFIALSLCILIPTIILSVLFIYGVKDSKLTNEPNAFTGMVHTRVELYIMATFCIFSIFTLFWTFIFFASGEFNKKPNH